MSRLVRVTTVLGIFILVSACGSVATQPTTQQSTMPSTAQGTAAVQPTIQSTIQATSAALTPVTLFMGYVPNIQFAPVYVAMDRGYFKQAGIDLKLENSFDETDGLTRLGTGQLQFGIISGDEVLLARSKGAPVVYVFAWYQRFPVGVVVPADSPIQKPEDLAGHVVGVPGKFGASYVGLQALLNKVNLKESDLKDVKAIGYDTAPVVCGGQVDASVIYVANEPAQIESKCFKVRVFQIADYANLVSNGIVTNDMTLSTKPDLVRGMNQALSQGLADTIADPNAAYTISLHYIDGLAANDAVQLAVLTNSIKLWKADKLGYSDPAAWALTQQTLQAMGLITSPLDLSKVFSNDYLPK